MKHSVADLSDTMLDAAVAKVLGYTSVHQVPEELCGTWWAGETDGGISNWEPRTNWNQGGPLIDKHKIDIEYGVNQGRGDEFECRASAPTKTGMTDWFEGETALVAAMRALVASHFGSSIDLP